MAEVIGDNYGKEYNFDEIEKQIILEVRKEVEKKLDK